MDYKLSGEEKEEIYQTFRLIDVNGDGKLSIDEIKRSAQKLGCNPTTEEVKEMIKDLDTDGNTYVSYEEYEEMMRQHLMSLAYEKEQLMRAFTKFDKDGSGTIDAKELSHVLRNYGEDKLTEEEVLEFFKDFDSNADGKICIEVSVKNVYEKGTLGNEPASQRQNQENMKKTQEYTAKVEFIQAFCLSDKAYANA